MCFFKTMKKQAYIARPNVQKLPNIVIELEKPVGGIVVKTENRRIGAAEVGVRLREDKGLWHQLVGGHLLRGGGERKKHQGEGKG